MLTKTIRKFLWNDLHSWEDSNYLVREVCAIHSRMNLHEPKFSSTLRIANRLKSQPRFRSRYQALQQNLSNNTH